MKVPNAVHEEGAWLIREIAHDFDLLDVWALPATGGPDDFGTFLETIASLDPGAGSAANRFLFRVRRRLGALLGWDRPSDVRTIPGSTQTSLVDRLPSDLRESALPLNAELVGAGARPLYRTADEAALEIANETVHGVLHLAWVETDDGGYRAHMAIYVKPRGALGRFYMMLIQPFRHLIVYPALMRQIGRNWDRRPAPTTR